MKKLILTFSVLVLLAGCTISAPSGQTPSKVTDPPVSRISPEPLIFTNTTLATQTPLPLLELEKGPYLLFTAQSDEISILWQSNQPERFIFEWGLDETYSLGRLSSEFNDITKLYQVTASRLIDGVQYFYRISTNQAEFTGTFLARPAEEAKALIFWISGDTRSGIEIHNQIASNILDQIAQTPDSRTLVLSTGDLMDFASEESLQNNEFSSQAPATRAMLASMPVVNVMGNHDGTAIFKQYFPYPYTPTNDWSFDYGPAHFLVINQYVDLSQGTTRWDWLRNDLAQSSKRWKFILLHEPGWSAGPHENNLTVQKIIHPLAVANGVQMVIGGHNHYYARAEVDGVIHLTTGGGGAPLYDPDLTWPRIMKVSKAFHYVRISITGNLMIIHALTPDGVVLDEFTILNEE